jgi:hypothetical protein
VCGGGGGVVSGDVGIEDTLGGQKRAWGVKNRS